MVVLTYFVFIIKCDSRNDSKIQKNKAKKVVKNNYWTAIIVCFLIALLTGEFGTSIVGILQSEDSMD